MVITENTKIKDVLKSSNARDAKRFLMYSKSRIISELVMATTVKKMHAMAQGIHPESGVRALELLEKASKEQEKFVYQIYSEDEMKKDPEKRDVVIMSFPVKEKSPFIVLCAGGAYESICTFGEALPVARVFNDLGYSVFTLNYRVKKKGLLPKPIEDLARAVSFIQENSERWNIDPNRYGIGGFSAGGHLVCEFCTDTHGYKTYGLTKPEVIFPIYPGLIETMPENKSVNRYCITLFGEHYAEQDKQRYDVIHHVSAFPPAYIVVCKDDDTVPYTSSVSLADALKEENIPCVLDMGNKGGHGFGEGRGTDVEGWAERAIVFWKELGKGIYK